MQENKLGDICYVSNIPIADIIYERLDCKPNSISFIADNLDQTVRTKKIYLFYEK
jgi:hypothetical protein